MLKLGSSGKVPAGWSGVSRDLLTGERFPPQWVRGEPATKQNILQLAKLQKRNLKTCWYDKLSIVGKRSPLYDTEEAKFKRENPRKERVKFFLRGRR